MSEGWGATPGEGTRDVVQLLPSVFFFFHIIPGNIYIIWQTEGSSCSVAGAGEQFSTEPPRI